MRWRLAARHETKPRWLQSVPESITQSACGIDSDTALVAEGAYKTGPPWLFAYHTGMPSYAVQPSVGTSSRVAPLQSVVTTLRSAPARTSPLQRLNVLKGMPPNVVAGRNPGEQTRILIG